MQYFATACAPQVRQLARQFQNAATEFPLVVDWSLDYGVDDDSGRSRQWLRSRLCTVHLEDVCGDVHCGVVIYVLELEARIVDRYLKTIYELGYGFLAPTVENSFASQWRYIVRISDELLIGFG